MLGFYFIGVINQVNVLILTHIFRVCVFLLTFLMKFLVVSSQDDFDILTLQFSLFTEHAILTIEVAMSCEVLSSIRSFVPTWRIIWLLICCCAWKMLDKNLAVTLTFFDIYQPFKCLRILSPNITTNFLLFELMSRLLIDELSSLLLAFF